MVATRTIDPAAAQIRALYRALLRSEDRFEEFKMHLALYDVNSQPGDEEPPKAAAVRRRLNERIQSWVAVPFDGMSAVQMLEWRAIIRGPVVICELVQ
jgi:hypothetical protein